MSVRKIVFSTIFLVVLVAFFGIGIFTLLKGDEYKNNEVVFEIKNELAYSSIEGWCYVGQEAIDNNQPTNHYEKTTYEQSDEYYSKTLDSAFPRWDVGESLMVFNDGEDGEEYQDIDIIKFVIEVENKNNELPLRVSLKNVGINENNSSSRRTNLCYTKIEYTINLDNVLVYDNEQSFANSKCEKVGNVINVNDMADLSVGEKITIAITFTRNTRSESFEIVNNFTLQLGTIE